jgi:hypothetical protein
MAGTINPEDCIAAIKTIIEADEGAKWSALTTEYTSTGPLVLADIEKIWTAPQERYPDKTSLVIVAVTTERAEEYGENNIYLHTLAFEVLERNNEEQSPFSSGEVLTKRIHRRVRGIHEILEAKRTLDDGSAVNADGLDFGPVAYSELDATGTLLEKRAEMSLTVLVAV